MTPVSPVFWQLALHRAPSHTLFPRLLSSTPTAPPARPSSRPKTKGAADAQPLTQSLPPSWLVPSPLLSVWRVLSPRRAPSLYRVDSDSTTAKARRLRCLVSPRALRGERRTLSSFALPVVSFRSLALRSPSPCLCLSSQTHTHRATRTRTHTRTHTHAHILG